MYRFLPGPVLSYLEEPSLYRDRLRFTNALLEESFTIDLISQALEKAQEHQSAGQALIRYLVYQLANVDKPLDNLNENYAE